MVKVSFNSALGQKDVKKDAETLLTEEDKVSRKWLTELTVSMSSVRSRSLFYGDRVPVKWFNYS